jgi:hypothetical protein
MRCTTNSTEPTDETTSFTLHYSSQSCKDRKSNNMSSLRPAATTNSPQSWSALIHCVCLQSCVCCRAVFVLQSCVRPNALPDPCLLFHRGVSQPTTSAVIATSKSRSACIFTSPPSPPSSPLLHRPVLRNGGREKGAPRAAGEEGSARGPAGRCWDLLQDDQGHLLRLWRR